MVAVVQAAPKLTAPVPPGRIRVMMQGAVLPWPIPAPILMVMVILMMPGAWVTTVLNVAGGGASAAKIADLVLVVAGGWARVSQKLNSQVILESFFTITFHSENRL